MPLRSMLKLSTMGKDLLQIDPQFLRVAVQHDARLRVDVETTVFQYVIADRSGAETKKAFHVDLLATGNRVDSTLPMAKSGLTWALLSLTPEGVDAMRHLQSRLNTQREDLAEIKVSVKTHFKDMEKATFREFPLDIWVLFEPDGRYIELLRGPVPIDTEEPPS